MPLSELLRRAARVINESQSDIVSAAKNAPEIFTAAHALLRVGQKLEALEYFEHGLRLSPWSLEEQLKRADLLKTLGRESEALKTARMVADRAETDALVNAAHKLLGLPPVEPPPVWKGQAKALCFVRIGPVENVVLKDTLEKISRTLGLPAYVHEDVLGQPQPDRSAFDRWMTKQVIAKIDWYNPAADRMLRSLGKSVPEEVPPRQLLNALDADLRRAGQEREADNLKEAAQHYLKWDRQWKASSLLLSVKKLMSARPGAKSPEVVIGITQADIYDGDSNYIFGTAETGYRNCITSYARFRAEYAMEPPDRKRLVSRQHRQLLSGIGFSLNVPRPIDPTSARAYPASVPEQDAKSEYMSEACIRGFEKALGQTLPAEAWPPDTRPKAD